MKTAVNLTTGQVDSTVVRKAIRESYNLSAKPRLRADWNLNRYTTPRANNVPPEATESYDADIFPVSSLVEPTRPSKGAPKAILNQSIIAPRYSKADDPRFYVADDEDKSKYWITPRTTNASGNFPLHNDGQTICRPYVVYSRTVKSNKIVLRFENTWATPKTFKVRTRTSALAESDNVNNGWTQITSSLPIAADGTLTLYYNGSTWSNVRPATLVATDLRGIMIAVDSMGGGTKKDGTPTTYTKRTSVTGPLVRYTTNGANSHCSVIAIEAHYEADLTDRLQNVSSTFDTSDVSQLYPIGRLTTNVGEITLSNEDDIFNNENDSSPYYKIMEPNVEFNLDYIYTIGGVKYSVQQFKMYGGQWNGQYSDEVTLSLEDSSKFLKLTKPNPTMYENKTVPELIWRVLDSVGFTDYVIDDNDITVSNTIPVFWTDGEKTVWEILDELATASQTAIYFDGNNKLQVKTREAAYNDAKTPNWTLYGQKTGDNLPDIEGFDEAGEFEANNIDVKYKTSKWRVGETGEPALAKVWEPESDTLTVRSAPLAGNFTTTSTKFYLATAQVVLWPYQSKVNIDGEILEYKGKEFVYYTYTKSYNSSGQEVYTAPVRHVVNVTGEDEYKKYHNMTPTEYQSRNYFTGALIIKERGMWHTVSSNHYTDASGYSTQSEYIRNDAGTRINPSGGFSHNKLASTAIIKTPASLRDAADTFWAYRGGDNDSMYRVMGARMKFNANAAAPTQRAGIAFSLNTYRVNGYYIELRPTSTISTAEQAITSEIMVYSKKGGKYVTIGNGARCAIVPGVFYDIDVYFTPGWAAGINDRISVWLNGQRVVEAVTSADTKQPASGRYAMYARGKTIAEYEYFYGTTTGKQEPADDYGFYDLIYGGMRGSRWIREEVYQLKTRTQKVGKKKVNITYKLNDYFFDEFGPYVHELREFNVKFDPAPVQNSSVFNTNEWYSAVVDYRSTPFGAKFTIANLARGNAILHGDDSMILRSAENTVAQVCTVLGRDLDISDEEVVNVKNIQAIRSRGQIDTELSSDWLQSKEMAEAVASWIAKHWSEGLDTVNVTIFGNPLIEVGDIVEVNYTKKKMLPATHRYFVTGVANGFDTGIETTLSLRRIRTAPDSALVAT